MVSSIRFPKAYAEVYSFINTLGDYYIKLIPENIYNTIRDYRDVNYNPIFDRNKVISKEMISQEALSLIAALNLQYWCKNTNEKAELKNLYIENTKRYEEQYSYDNLFKNKKKDGISEVEQDTTQEMIVYKESFIKKVFNKLLSWIGIRKS